MAQEKAPPRERHPATAGVAGLLGGGAAAAVAGAMLLGPVGIAAGAVVGAVAGAPLGDALGATRRRLLEDERKAALLVFGDSLDLEAVRIAAAPFLGMGHIARTPGNTAFFPVESYRNGIKLPWLIHELTHVWQHQHGIGLARKLIPAIRGLYDYGGEAALRKAAAEGRRFVHFNTEQQGDILQHYYERTKRGEDVGAWQPFVDQVQVTPRGARAC